MDLDVGVDMVLVIHGKLCQAGLTALTSEMLYFGALFNGASPVWHQLCAENVNAKFGKHARVGTRVMCHHLTEPLLRVKELCLVLPCRKLSSSDATCGDKSGGCQSQALFDRYVVGFWQPSAASTST